MSAGGDAKNFIGAWVCLFSFIPPPPFAQHGLMNTQVWSEEDAASPFFASTKRRLTPGIPIEPCHQRSFDEKDVSREYRDLVPDLYNFLPPG